MNKLIKKEEITVDGVVWVVETYERGVVKYQKPIETEPIEQGEPFDKDVAMLELLSMTEYNTCLLEMQMEF